MPARRETGLELIECVMGSWFSALWDAALGIVLALFRLAFALTVLTLVLGTSLLTGAAGPADGGTGRRRPATRGRPPGRQLIVAWAEGRRGRTRP